MQIKSLYSHLNGEEFLLVHRPALWEEVKQVIAAVDAEACRTKVSRERTMRGRLLYSPRDMNDAFKAEFKARDWGERRNSFYVAPDEKLLRGVYDLADGEQRIGLKLLAMNRSSRTTKPII